MNILDPKNIFDTFAIFSLVATSIVVVLSKIRNNDLEILRNSNTDLRDSIDDKSKKINIQENRIIELEKDIESLSQRLTIIEAKNSELSNLVHDALVTYFQHNPKIAQNLKTQL